MANFANITLCALTLLYLLTLAPLTFGDPGNALLGIALDSTHATAAYFGELGPTVVSAVHGNQVYQDYMHDTFRNAGRMTLRKGIWVVRLDNGTLVPRSRDYHDSDKAKAVFSDILQVMIAKARAETAMELSLGAISYPRHLNDSSLETLYSAAQGLKQPLSSPLRLQRSHLAAFFTYPESDCYEWGTDDDNLEDDGGQVVLIERGFGNLTVMHCKTAQSGIWEFRIVKRSVRNVKMAAEIVWG